MVGFVYGAGSPAFREDRRFRASIASAQAGISAASLAGETSLSLAFVRSIDQNVLGVPSCEHSLF